MSGQALQFFFVYFDTESRGHRRTGCAASHFNRTENILLAETHKAGHLAAGLSVLQCAVKLHFGGGKNGRTRASLADDNRKPLGSDDRSHFQRFLKSADVREFDLQQIGGARSQHRQCVLRRKVTLSWAAMGTPTAAAQLG